MAVVALATVFWTAGARVPGRSGSAGATRSAASPAAPAEDTSPSARNAALHVAKPAVVRGLYLNAWAAGSPRKLEKLLGIADRTEINTFVIDVKEGGQVSYISAVPLVHG
ncbi:MAG TPA: putative glycoside hydrolase, partial [Longimicrobiales bacterium]